MATKVFCAYMTTIARHKHILGTTITRTNYYLRYKVIILE